MESSERREKFVALLQQLLEECDGIKGKLAKRLGIKPNRLTGWLKGTIDPASLEVLVFDRIAKVTLQSTDELAKNLGVVELNKEEQKYLDRFKGLVEELLSSQSQEQLGKKLGVSRGAISAWISSEKNVNPGRIPVSTIAALANERGWTIERLLVYIGLKKSDEVDEDLFAKIQSQITQMSFPYQIKILIWLSSEFEKSLENFERKIQARNEGEFLSDKKVCIVLENDNISLASHYLKNLSIHTQFQLENISVATATKISEPLSAFDVLVVDVASDESPCLSLIEQIEFDGALVVFADSGLSEAIRDRLLSQVTDLLIKPILGNELKDKSYFS